MNVYDEEMREASREFVRAYLRFYFEFSFVAGEEGEYPVNLVAEANDYLMKIEDENTSDHELVGIYQMALTSLGNSGNIEGYNALPVRFLRDDTGIPYGASF